MNGQLCIPSELLFVASTNPATSVVKYCVVARLLRARPLVLGLVTTFEVNLIVAGHRP